MIKIQTIFAILHFIFFIIYFSFTPINSEQYALIWIPWFIIDFPISIFYSTLHLIFSKTYIIAFIVHGVFGSVWWFYFAKFWFYGFKKLSFFVYNKKSFMQQIIVAFMHIFMVILYFYEALENDILYFMHWFVWIVIDFPISIFFTLLSCFFHDLNSIALIVFGIFGTILWYLVAGFIFDGLSKLFKKK